MLIVYRARATELAYGVSNHGPSIAPFSSLLKPRQLQSDSSVCWICIRRSLLVTMT